MDDLIEDLFAFVTCTEGEVCPDCGAVMVRDGDRWLCGECDPDGDA